MDKLGIAFIAHDKKKDTMVKFCKTHESILLEHELYATGNTGQKIMNNTNLYINKVSNGSKGGDTEIGTLVSEKKIDLVIFLRDPFSAQYHEPDIQTLVKLCDVFSTPIATNLASAEVFMKSLYNGESKFRLDK